MFRYHRLSDDDLIPILRVYRDKSKFEELNMIVVLSHLTLMFSMRQDRCIRYLILGILSKYLEWCKIHNKNNVDNIIDLYDTLLELRSRDGDKVDYLKYGLIGGIVFFAILAIVTLKLYK